MSPLARSLLALAVAALLHAACAQYEPTKCTVQARGTDGRRIEFPLMHLNASLGREICFDLTAGHGNKDIYCQHSFDDEKDTYELVGVSARACDYEVEPVLDIHKNMKEICVYREGIYLEPDATLLIWEFCLPKPNQL